MSDLHIVYGSGPLGRSIMNELVRQGKPVRIINRSGLMPECPEEVEVVSVDLYDSGAVREVSQGAAVAYQCAQPHYWEWSQKFPPLQAAIMEGLAGTGTRLVIGENTYMYGDTDGQPQTEDLPYAAHTRKGKVRAAMSEAALDTHRQGKLEVTMARGSDFFGPWVLDSAYGDRLFYPALAGKSAGLVGNIDLPHTATYIEDFGRAMVLLGDRAEAFGRAWHVPSDRPQITQRQFTELVYEQLGSPPRMSSMGKWMMRIGGIFVPGAREMVEMMYEFEKPFVVDSTQFENAFGMQPTPLAEAITATLDWYRANPKSAS